MAHCPARSVRAPRLMGAVYQGILARLVARGFGSPRAPVRIGKPLLLVDAAASRDRLMPGTVHIIGAGLAGLAAAVRLTGRGVPVTLHEAANHAGGRCRTYHDPALGMTIDNGNHLVLSGNRATMDFVTAIGARTGYMVPPAPRFPWSISRPTSAGQSASTTGRFPRWIFDRTARVPATTAMQYLPLARLLWAKPDRAIGELLACEGPVYERLLDPLLRAALNTEPREASAALAAAVLRETIAIGGSACHPLIAAKGFGRLRRSGTGGYSEARWHDPFRASAARIGLQRIAHYRARLRRRHGRACAQRRCDRRRAAAGRSGPAA